METMFTQMQQFMTELTAMTRSQLARWDAVWPDVQRAQEQGVRHLEAAIDDVAHLGNHLGNQSSTQLGIQFGTQIAKQSLAMWAEMSRASLAMMRHGVEGTLPRTPAA